jgi:hypothetical protein
MYVRPRQQVEAAIQGAARTGDREPARICKIPGCASEIKVRHLMCFTHWCEVPMPLREDLTRALSVWLGGQDSARPYLLARAQAIVHVGKLHGLDISREEAMIERFKDLKGGD